MMPNFDGHIRLRLGELSARVDPLGAELRSLRRAGDEYLWQDANSIWAHAAPILFPFVGRLNGGGFEHDGRFYTMPMHGFAGASWFEPRDRQQQQAHRAVLQLRDNAQTRACFPFEFRLRVSFTLNPQGIDVGYEVLNPGAQALPFALGSHPAFALGDGPLQDWRIEFDKAEAPEVYRLDGGLLAERPVPFCFEPERSIALSPTTFVGDALIFKNINSTCISLVHRSQGPRLKLWTGDAPHLGLWAAPNTGFVCIEPWFGVDEDKQAPVALAEKSGLQRLAPGTRFACGYRIEVGDH